MPNQPQVDFGRTSQDYAAHRAGFPESFFKKLEALGLFAPGARVLDLGTGTGTLARGFALRGCAVTGLDISENQMAAARGLDEKAGVKIAYVKGHAEETGFAGESFDIVTAGQCFHWFDRKRATAEISRILKPSGRFVIAHFDWLERAGNPVGAMYALQEKYNPGWKTAFPLGFYPQRPGDVAFEGFAAEASFLYEEDVPYTHEGWGGRIRAYAGIGGSLPQEAVARFDAEFAVLLEEKFPEAVMPVPHKVWAEVWRKNG